jgi:hypothetical protein
VARRVAVISIVDRVLHVPIVRIAPSVATATIDPREAAIATTGRRVPR